MGSPYVGEIRIFAGNYSPQGWAFCDGSLLSIAEHEVLFVLIGTTYGGNGETDFRLPDLRGRVPLHQGQGTTGSAKVIGETSGEESVSLTPAQLPGHTHIVQCTPNNATLTNPAGNIWAYDGSGITAGYSAPNLTGAASMAPGAVSPAGGNQPHTNLQPFLALNYIISLFGIFPNQT